MAAIFYVGAVLLGILIWGTFAYNRIVHYLKLADRSWHDISDLLSRRWDLIPKLLEVVRAAALPEETVLRQVSEARERAMTASGPAGIASAEEELKLYLFSLFSAVEGHPDLWSSDAFAKVQSALADAEDEIQQARKYYNAVVKELNDLVSTFPRSVVAALFGFGSREYFATAEEMRRETATVIV
jgi:LemA protein